MARVRYERLATEQPNPASRALDRMSPLAVARLMACETVFLHAPGVCAECDEARASRYS